MILLAVGYMHYPYFVMVKSGENLSLLTLHASEKTISDLGWALCIGSLLILPSLFYLYFSFQKRSTDFDH
jgi:cytochrome d ubiquinol oxidase subunit II